MSQTFTVTLHFTLNYAFVSLGHILNDEQSVYFNINNEF